jgi:hypothetical protein
MRRFAALALVALGVLEGGASVCAQDQRRVPVEVVDAAADAVYVQPGSEAGLHRGAIVRIGERRFEVRAVTRQYGVVDVGERRVPLGARGTAVVRAERAETGQRLPAPRPLAAFRGQWPDATMPATEQRPDFVPLGESLAERKLDLALSTTVAMAIPYLGGGTGVGYGDLRARVHAEPFDDLPIAFDADAAVQLWVASNLDARSGRESAPYVRVRELSAAYGEDAGFFAALGRLRYAAATIGQLDGARVQSPAFGGGFTIGAFGGFLPDPLEGKPVFDAARFGLEAAYRAPEHELAPMVHLVGSGSTFGGALDERRVAGVVQLFPGESRIGGHFEVSFFDPDNPWDAGEVELSAAGIDGTLRLGPFHLGARGDMRRPERSFWLASYLPASFLCARTPGAPSTPSANETCASQFEPRYLGALDTGLTLEHFAVAAGGTIIYVGEQDDLDQLGGWLSVRGIRLFDIARAELTGMVATGLFLETFALRLDVGAEVLKDVLDVSVHYRPAITRYRADVDRYVEHMVGGAIRVSPLPELDVTLDVELLESRDAHAFLGLVGVTFRPDLL